MTRVPALVAPLVAIALWYSAEAWKSLGNEPMPLLGDALDYMFSPIELVEAWIWPNRWTFYTPHASVFGGPPTWFSTGSRIIWLTIFLIALWFLLQVGAARFRQRNRQTTP